MFRRQYALEILHRELVSKKQKGMLARLVKGGLTIASFVFNGVVRGRNFLYDINILSSKSAERPVISIGNLVAGGTGKTPLTLLLAKALEPFFRVGIVLRGFRSLTEKENEPRFVKDGNCEDYGDEAVLLAKRLPEAIVVVGKQRYRAAQLAVSRGAEVILLDDGMQHRKLKRDIEIVVVKGQDPFGGKAFLPRGYLRDEPRSLKRADLIISDGEPKIEELRKYSEAPVVCVEREVNEIEFFGGKRMSVTPGMCVGIFCGIAHPERFVQTVRQMHLEIISSTFLADHEKMEEKKLHAFADEAKEKGAEMLLCTEKDAVKLGVANFSLPIGWVKIDLQIKENSRAWEDLIERIKGRL